MVFTTAARRVVAAGGIRQHPATTTNRRLQSTLAIFEQRDGQLNMGSLSAVTAAKRLGGPIHGFVAGGNIQGAANDASKVDGVEKVIAVDNSAYDKVS
jgi:electron transfer flavoprotein alpha subunit